MKYPNSGLVVFRDISELERKYCLFHLHLILRFHFVLILRVRCLIAYVFCSTNDFASLEQQQKSLSIWHEKFPKFPTERFGHLQRAHGPFDK